MKISANKGGGGTFRLVISKNEMEYLTDDKGTAQFLLLSFDQENKLFTLRIALEGEPFRSKAVVELGGFSTQRTFRSLNGSWLTFSVLDPTAKTGSMEVAGRRMKTLCFVLPERLTAPTERHRAVVRDVTPPKGKTDRLRALLDALNKEAKVQGAELFIRDGEVCARVLTVQEL